jgi:hypothetical protein
MSHAGAVQCRIVTLATVFFASLFFRHLAQYDRNQRR